MRNRRLLSILRQLAVAVLVALLVTGGVPAGAAERTPILLELFTSEGCSSCPPADQLLNTLMATQPIEGIEIIGLSEHVDYWDELGWHDPFSSPRYTRRQADYARAFGDPQRVFTPQVVVHGRESVLGVDFVNIRRVVQAAAAAARVPLSVLANRTAGRSVSVRVRVGDVPVAIRKGKLRLHIALVQDELVTQVERGENANKRLSHDAVVRVLEAAGAVEDGAVAAEFSKDIATDAAWAGGKLRAVAFLQDDKSRRVVGVGAAPVAVAAASQ